MVIPSCRPSQEVLDAVEGDVEAQEKVCTHLHLDSPASLHITQL